MIRLGLALLTALTVCCCCFTFKAPSSSPIPMLDVPVMTPEIEPPPKLPWWATEQFWWGVAAVGASITGGYATKKGLH